MEERTIERFLACGDPHHGFARIYCDACGHDYLLADAYDEALPGARPGLIRFVQTFGDWVNFNPHRHVLAADGAFLPDERFAALPMERSPPLDFASGPPYPRLPLTYPPVPDLA